MAQCTLLYQLHWLPDRRDSSLVDRLTKMQEPHVEDCRIFLSITSSIQWKRRTGIDDSPLINLHYTSIYRGFSIATFNSQRVNVSQPDMRRESIPVQLLRCPLLLLTWKWCICVFLHMCIIYIYMYKHVYTYIYMYIYMHTVYCICTYVSNVSLLEQSGKCL